MEAFEDRKTKNKKGSLQRRRQGENLSFLRERERAKVKRERGFLGCEWKKESYSNKYKLAVLFSGYSRSCGCQFDLWVWRRKSGLQLARKTKEPREREARNSVEIARKVKWVFTQIMYWITSVKPRKNSAPLHCCLLLVKVKIFSALTE